MMRKADNHGDHKTRKILRVRVQRDRRHIVVSAVDGRIGCRRRGVCMSGRIGLEIAPERGDTALVSDFGICPAAESCRRRSRSVGCRADDLQTDHEVRGIAEIVSIGRPQAVYNANRIARANKSGAALPHARRRTCDAASIACKMVKGSRSALRVSPKLSVGWECAPTHFRRMLIARRFVELFQSVGSPRCATFRLPRGGHKNRLIEF